MSATISDRAPTTTTRITEKKLRSTRAESSPFRASSGTLVQPLSSANLHRNDTDRHQEDELHTPRAGRNRKWSEQQGNSHDSGKPSDVVDELEALKRRINNLEASPLHSLRGYGETRSAERIRPSTIESFSPALAARGYGTSASPNHTHPLLRATISKLRMSSLSPDLVRPLDLAVSDAISLANARDETRRSRVESLCRSLTAICLFLAEQEPTHSLQANGHYADTGTDTSLFGKSHSRARSTSSTVGHSRTSGSRRSLSEILNARNQRSRRSPSLEPDRSVSRLSRITDDRPTNLSGYAGAQSSASVANKRHARYQSTSVVDDGLVEQSHHDKFHYTNSQIGTGERLHSSVGSYQDRAPSRAATEVLGRPPVTRESLYARYQRAPPAKLRTDDATTEDARFMTMSHSSFVDRTR